MKILERLPSLSRLPRWRVLCEGCREERILSCWKSEIRKNRRCRSCSLLGNHRGIFRRFAPLALALVLSSACGGAPFTTLEAASLASGDDAGPLEDQRASAHPDDGGGSRWDGGGDADPTTDPDGGSPEAAPDALGKGDAGEASAPLPDASDAGADARADAELDAHGIPDSPPDALSPPPDAAPDAPALCCIGKTQIGTLGACPTMYVVEPYSGSSSVGAFCTNSDCNGTVEVCP